MLNATFQVTQDDGDGNVTESDLEMTITEDGVLLVTVTDGDGIILKMWSASAQEMSDNMEGWDCG
jgi:hypothetical protein